MKKRVYICHTFYHVYISLLMEMNLDSAKRGEATMLLSTMSNNFGTLKDRLLKAGIFENVYMFDEKEDTTSEEVMSYHKERGNIVLNLLQRIKYTKLLGKLQEPYIPVDLEDFEERYVFCDSDPIGYYLNYKKLRYHSMEDGLDTCSLDDQAKVSNRGAFKIKCFMASLGLIFIENGYSRYAIDFVVNDISKNPDPPKNIREMNVMKMWENLTPEDHLSMVNIFLDDPAPLLKKLDASRYDKPCIMILTEPLCANDVRIKLFSDIVDKYKNDYTVIIKPHPRDLVDYEEVFPNAVIIRERFPMEVMNDIPGLEVQKLISVITQVKAIRFAKEIEFLGFDFLDLYEDPEIHRKN